MYIVQISSGYWLVSATRKLKKRPLTKYFGFNIGNKVTTKFNLDHKR